MKNTGTNKAPANAAPAQLMAGAGPIDVYRRPSPCFGDFRGMGKLAVVDALHTQDLTVQKLHFECGADYLMTVKANQKSLYQTLEAKLQPQLFPPSTDPGHPSPQTGA